MNLQSVSIPDEMDAAVYHGRGDVRIERRAVPSPGPGEVLLRVAFAGVCGSDVAEYKSGPLLTYIEPEPHPLSGHAGPMVPGHELAGFVVAQGPGATMPIGTLVSCGAGISCGHCGQCLLGRTNLCDRYHTIGLHRDGGLAEYCATPEDICVEAESVGPLLAGISQPAAIAIHAFRRGEVTAGDPVAVLGAGGIGAFLSYAAIEAGAEVTVVDVDPARLELAARLGAQHCLLASAIEAEEALAARYVCVYEVSGSEVGLETARQFATRGDRIVLAGLQKPGVGVEGRTVTLDELAVLGTSAHVVGTDLPEALRVLGSREGGWDDIAPVAFPLADLVAEGLNAGGARIKTVFAPWSDRRMPAAEADLLALERLAPAEAPGGAKAKKRRVDPSPLAAGSAIWSWEEVAPASFVPGLSVRLISGAGVTIGKVEMQGGTATELHRHDHEQLTYVTSGALDYTIGEGAEPRRIVAGEVAYVPGGISHAVAAPQDAAFIEVFAPRRDDLHALIEGSEEVSPPSLS